MTDYWLYINVGTENRKYEIRFQAENDDEATLKMNDFILLLGKTETDINANLYRKVWVNGI